MGCLKPRPATARLALLFLLLLSACAGDLGDGPGAIEQLASSERFISQLALSEHGLFGVSCNTSPDAREGQIGLVDQAGGLLSTLALLDGCPLQLKATSRGLYWLLGGLYSSNPRAAQRLPAAVQHLPAGGGQVITLASGSFGGLAVDEGHVYWTNCALQDGTLTSGELQRLSHAGGSPETLATLAGCGFQLVLDEQYLFFTAQESIKRLAKSGGQPETIAAALSDLTLAGEYLYGTSFYQEPNGPNSCNHQSTTLLQMRKDGSQKRSIGLLPGSSDVLVVDQSDAYWSSNCSELLRFSLVDGRTLKITGLSPGITAIAADDRAVYWVDVPAPGTRIMRMAKR